MRVLIAAMLLFASTTSASADLKKTKFLNAVWRSTGFLTKAARFKVKSVRAQKDRVTITIAPRGRTVQIRDVVAHSINDVARALVPSTGSDLRVSAKQIRFRSRKTATVAGNEQRVVRFESTVKGRDGKTPLWKGELTVSIDPKTGAVSEAIKPKFTEQPVGSATPPHDPDGPVPQFLGALQ